MSIDSINYLIRPRLCYRLSIPFSFAFLYFEKSGKGSGARASFAGPAFTYHFSWKFPFPQDSLIESIFLPSFSNSSSGFVILFKQRRKVTSCSKLFCSSFCSPTSRWQHRRKAKTNRSFCHNELLT